MALSGMLGEAGLTPERIETHADVTLEKVGANYEVTAVGDLLELRVDRSRGCPVSKLLKAKITMIATLEA
jgi:lipoyl-dependent peroxiredoxin